MRLRTISTGVGLALLGGALLGCGSEDVAVDVSGFDDATTEYDGPLHVDAGRYGAAGEALHCRPVDGQVARAATYAEGATSDSPEQALETAVSEGLFLFAPTDELRLAKAEEDRVLLVHEDDGRILMALVLRDGPGTAGAGGDGWYLEAAARCDFSEFPEAFAEKAGYRLWRDRHGDPAPVSRIYSAPGPEHCDWQSMEFLFIGDEKDVFVHEPTRELGRFIGAPYREDVRLPADAVDTGYERDGRHAWLAADGRYAYVGTRAQVDAWPRFDAGCD